MLTPYFRGFFGYCPHCGKDRFTKGLFGTKETCAHCGLHYKNAPGDFIGAASLGYGVVSIPILILGMLLVAFTELSLISIMVIGVGLILLLGILTHQPIKGLWLAFLVDNGALQPPEKR